MSLTRGSTIGGATALVVEECPTCGVVYAIPQALKEKGLRHKRNASLYCPNGHCWHYLGKTHAQELEELRDRVAFERSQRDQVEAQLVAQRGATTRARNERDRLKQRAAAGVCPCCHRTFKQLAAHMRTKHPDYPEEST